jgi:hypothetical protein
MSGMEEVKATAHVHASPAPRASLQKCVDRGSRACSDEQAHCQGASVQAHCEQKAKAKIPQKLDAQRTSNDAYAFKSTCRACPTVQNSAE